MFFLFCGNLTLAGRGGKGFTISAKMSAELFWFIQIVSVLSKPLSREDSTLMPGREKTVVSCEMVIQQSGLA